jgi:hypothetical protein
MGLTPRWSASGPDPPYGGFASGFRPAPAPVVLRRSAWPRIAVCGGKLFSISGFLRRERGAVIKAAERLTARWELARNDETAN